MKRPLLIWLLLLPVKSLFVQPADEVTQQCSSIRELVYAGWYHQFNDIIGDQLNTSSGHSESPFWSFTNTKYYVDLKWPGSDNSFISDYTEETDSFHTRNLQYIAEMGNYPEYLQAYQLLKLLNKQIEGCPYLQDDSLKSEFRSLPSDSLPPSCPAELQQASLYELPLRDTIPDLLHQLSIMTGIEQIKKYYRVSLIVEDRRMQKKHAGR